MKIPEKPPAWASLIAGMSSERILNLLSMIRSPEEDGRYLHWDELRHRPSHQGFSHQEWWLGIKLQRKAMARTIPLLDTRGQPFSYTVPPFCEAYLHEITQRAGGMLGAQDQVVNPASRNWFLVRNLMEEGITSSLLEGAATTRAKAREMLQQKREPATEGERMVANNYAAMQFIIHKGDAPLTPELIFELHEIITRGTLENQDAAGRFRFESEDVQIVDSENNVLHDPPPASSLPKRMADLCDFANGKSQTDSPNTFVHPVIRSILLHFWLGYDHPFVDGNGRTARAIFYWSMLRQHHWLVQFISISQVILKAPIQYGRAYLHSETDDNDCTYFLIHQLKAIRKALDQLHQFIDEQVKSRTGIISRLKRSSDLNDRQIDLLGHALRHPDADYTIEMHQNNNDVVYQTARTDLLGLVDRGLLTQRKKGRVWHFQASTKLLKLLESLA